MLENAGYCPEQMEKYFNIISSPSIHQESRIEFLALQPGKRTKKHGFDKSLYEIWNSGAELWSGSLARDLQWNPGMDISEGEENTLNEICGKKFNSGFQIKFFLEEHRTDTS